MLTTDALISGADISSRVPSSLITRRSTPDAASIKRVILDPTSEFPDTAMPKYGTRLKPHQIDALAEYLSSRQE
jgi:hypothetical protein